MCVVSSGAIKKSILMFFEQEHFPIRIRTSVWCFPGRALVCSLRSHVPFQKGLSPELSPGRRLIAGQIILILLPQVLVGFVE